MYILELYSERAPSVTNGQMCSSIQPSKGTAVSIRPVPLTYHLRPSYIVADDTEAGESPCLFCDAATGLSTMMPTINCLETIFVYTQFKH